jgi:hypothetical protein
LQLTASTEVLILDKLDYNLHFFHAAAIASFNKRIHNKWAMTSIIVVVIQLQGVVDNRFKLIIADGDSPKNAQTIYIKTF